MKETNKKYVLSIDAETNGLWGNAFAIAAIVYAEKETLYKKTSGMSSKIISGTIRIGLFQEGDSIPEDEIKYGAMNGRHIIVEHNEYFIKKEYVEIDKISLRIPNSFVTNEWVIENVLPTLDFDITHQNEQEMLEAFAGFYVKYKNEAEIIWHMGHVVEANLFRNLVEKELIGEWDAPYTPIEVSTMLMGAGESPDSVDNYIKKHEIEVKDYGSTHNPLYDCEVAAKVYFHMCH